MKKREITKLCSILLTMALLLGALPMAAFAAGESTALETAGTMTSGVYHLEKDLQGDLTIPDGATVSIDLRGHDIQGTGRGSVITIEVGGKLTLTDSDTERIRYGRWVDNSYTLNNTQQEGDDVLIGGCINGGYTHEYYSFYGYYGNPYGGGIFNQGVFKMQGGNIVGNEADKGGGVANLVKTADAKVSFTMTGGTITGNNVLKGMGGGVANFANARASEASFIMTGGTITDNQAKEGGGLYNYANEIGSQAISTVSGNAEISQNNNNGICNYVDHNFIGGINAKAIVNLTGNAVVKENRPSGVMNLTSGNDIGCVTALLHINENAKVQNNSAAGVENECWGEGKNICVMQGNAVIENNGYGVSNRAVGGGDVAFIMDGDAKIQNNIGEKEGGGICHYADNNSSASVTIHSGTITGNQGKICGGIYSYPNKANPFIKYILSGAAKITGNTQENNDTPSNIYLQDQDILTVTNPLSADAKIGVTTAVPPTEEKPVIFVKAADGYTLTAEDMQKFTSDAGYTVDSRNGQLIAHTHSSISVIGQAPTCTEDGWKDYYTCSCGKFFEDAACKKEIKDLDAWKNGAGKLEKFGHTPEKITEQPATNGQDGVRAYYTCATCGKCFEDAACENEIKDLDAWKNGAGKLEKLGYLVTEGQGSSWTKDSEETLTFRSNGDFAKFTGLQIDGTLVPTKHYTAKAGSTVVTLDKAYLQSLGVGEHTITFLYADGQCDATFTVAAAPVSPTPAPPAQPDIPKTGANSAVTLSLLLGIAAAGGLVSTAWVRKKNFLEK